MPQNLDRSLTASRHQHEGSSVVGCLVGGWVSRKIEYIKVLLFVLSFCLYFVLQSIIICLFPLYIPGPWREYHLLFPHWFPCSWKQSVIAASGFLFLGGLLGAAGILLFCFPRQLPSSLASQVERIEKSILQKDQTKQLLPVESYIKMNAEKKKDDKPSMKSQWVVKWKDMERLNFPQF